MTSVRTALGRGASATIAAVTALALVAGCGTAVAGQASGVPVNLPPQCESAEPTAILPGAGSQQILRIGSLSPWSPAWIHQESVIIYSDGTAVAPVARVRSDQAKASAPAGTQVQGSQSASGSGKAAIEPLSGGWVDRCELEKLLHRAGTVGRSDTGTVNNVMDAGTATVWIAAGEHRAEVSLSVYALGMGDDDNPDLTSEQEAARRQLSGWITDVRASVHHTGTLPLERILLRESTSGPRPSAGSGPPVSWQGKAPTPTKHVDHWTPCQLLTGAAATNAVRNAERSLAANRGENAGTSSVYWAEYTVSGSSRHFGLTAVAPGQDCR